MSFTNTNQSSNSKNQFEIDSFSPNKNLESTPKKNKETNKMNLFSSTKESKLPKPDFSPFIINENKPSFKVYGSYKKPKIIFPESPEKTPNQKFFTPSTNNKIIGKNLFGGISDFSNSLINKNIFRKLNFDSNEDEIENDNSSQSNNEEEFFGIFSKKNKIIENKSEKFNIISSISSGNFTQVFKCINKEDNQIYALKKSKKFSNLKELKHINQISNDLNSININSPYSKFICKYNDIWLEEDENGVKNLYALTKLYDNGDLFDYLSSLENKNFNFNNAFYWDIIFQMLCGVYHLHQIGYLHLDIKPENFLVDSFGNISISDFGLSQRKQDLYLLNDILEGDVIYLSPEIFNRKSPSEIDEKSDVFSLGMTILELMSKVNLPKNGDLWRLMRNKNFTLNMLPKEFTKNWNIVEISEFGNLIQYMICSYENRKNILELFEIIDELKIRNIKLINGNFMYFNHGYLTKIEEEDFNSSNKKNDRNFNSPVITPSKRNNHKNIKFNDEKKMEVD